MEVLSNVKPIHNAPPDNKPVKNLNRLLVKVKSAFKPSGPHHEELMNTFGGFLYQGRVGICRVGFCGGRKT